MAVIASNAHTHAASAMRLPPQSIEAEQSVLGALLIDNQGWDKVADRLLATDFYRQEHRLIFEALEILARKNMPFDVLTVSEALRQKNALDLAGGEVYLFELSNNTPSIANVSAYADIVREKSVLRQLIGTAGIIADTAFNPQGRSSAEVLDTAERAVFKIAEQGMRGGGPVAIRELAANALERIDTLFHSDKQITGLATGFTDLDLMTSGLQPADMVIVAGRPSMGKTAFAVNIAEHVICKNKKPTLIFSMEMPGESIAMRLLSSLGRIEQSRVRSGKLQPEDWPRITSAVSILSEAPLFIDDTPALSPVELRARVRRLAREQGDLGLIVIDYLQLMQVPGLSDNRVAEISEISRSLKSLAREMNIPIIALSQLNRSLESRTDKRPVMSDLRESGAIEQDADLILFIYRDEVYHPDTTDKGVAEIIIAKQRNGPIGKVRLAFLGQLTKFEDLAHQSYSVE